MKPFELYRATAGYRRLKFLFGFCLTLLTTALYAVIVGLSSLASPVLSYFMLPVWIALSLYLCRQLSRAVGWRLDAGHLYLVTAGFSEGEVPQNALSLVNEILDFRFGKKRYLALRARIHRAVKEINHSLLTANSLVGDIPGMRLMNQIGRSFLGLHLVYMRDCCLSYVFLQTDRTPEDASPDGCAFYSVNWKQLSERASDVSIFSAVIVIVPTAALGIALGFLMQLIGLGAFAYFGGFLAFMLVLSIKYAALDSYFMIHYIDRFLRMASHNAPSEQCYRQLSRVSPAFAAMMRRTEGHTVPAQPRLFSRKKRRLPKAPPVRTPDASHPVVCPKCRSANRANAKFCAGCGIRLK